MDNITIAHKPPATPAQSGVSRARQGRTPSRRKSRLVDLGAVFLARGEMGIVAAITLILQNRGWRHV